MPHELDRSGILNVRHLDNRPRQYRDPRCAIHVQWPRVPCARGGQRLGRTAVIRGVVQHPAVSTEHGGIGRVAESYGALHDRLEHWLNIGVGAADDPKDLTGRCLLLEGLGELTVPGL